MVSPRIRNVKDESELERVIDDFMTQGYTVKERGDKTILLKKNTWGSAAGLIVTWFVGLLFSVATIGLSLLLPIFYMVLKHYEAPEVLVRTE